MESTIQKTEHAPFLLTFGETLAPRVAALIRIRPSLVKRLVFANRSAHHCLVAYLYHGPDIGLPDSELAEIIEETSPRCLLRFAIENPHPRMYRILNRAGDRAQDASYYMRLDKLLKSPIGSMLADNDAEELSSVRLTYYEEIQQLHPVIHSNTRLRAAPKHRLEAASLVIEYLRAMQVLHEDDLNLPEKTGMKAFTRRLHAALDRIQSPRPKLNLPSQFHQVSNIGELRNYGRRFRNCLGRFGSGGEEKLLRLGSGTSMFIVVEEPVPMIAELRLAMENVRFVAEARGVKNQFIDKAGKLPILMALRESSFTVLDEDPASALSTFSFDYRSNRRGGFAFDDEDPAA
jgi:hypothetical protein